jgi:hypothetical protein
MVTKILRRICALFLLFQLTSCGNVSSSANSVPLPTPRAILSPLPDTSAGPPLNKPVSPFDIAGLHIQADGGFQCPNDPLYPPTGNIVLAENRLTYTQQEITQMISYVAGTPKQNTLPPPTLRWVAGGSITPIPGEYDTATVPCGGWIDVTNTGNISVQIPQIGVQFTKSPIQNPYSYRLINFCSLWSSPEPNCLAGKGGNPTCNIYSATIELGMGRTGLALATPVNNPCGMLTLKPTALVRIFVDFTLSPGTSDNPIYSVVPELTIDTISGKEVLSLPQLASKLVFASSQQFSCYKLQGTTFVLEDPSTLTYLLSCQ